MVRVIPAGAKREPGSSAGIPDSASRFRDDRPGCANAQPNYWPRLAALANRTASSAARKRAIALFTHSRCS